MWCHLRYPIPFPTGAHSSFRTDSSRNEDESTSVVNLITSSSSAPDPRTTRNSPERSAPRATRKQKVKQEIVEDEDADDSSSSSNTVDHVEVVSLTASSDGSHISARGGATAKSGAVSHTGARTAPLPTQGKTI